MLTISYWTGTCLFIYFFATKLAKAEWVSGKLFVWKGELWLCWCAYVHARAVLCSSVLVYSPRRHASLCISVCVCAYGWDVTRKCEILRTVWITPCLCVCASCLSVGVRLCDYLCLVWLCVLCSVCVGVFICPVYLPLWFVWCSITNCSLSESLQLLRRSSCPPSSFSSSLLHSPAFMEAINNPTRSPCLTWF